VPLPDSAHPGIDLLEPIVIALALDDKDPQVIQWAISCLGYQARGPAALAAALSYAEHHDPRVRFAVADALPSLIESVNLDESAVATLTKMTNDPDPDVRAYALMGLTMDLGLVDQMQSVLQDHLTDPDEQIRHHARTMLNDPTS
jgi:HEAT repeat protein